MRAVVVYESHWGNTRAVAEAIAEGIGPEAIALNTDQAFGPDLEAADLIVAGAPVIAFGLAGDRGIAGVRNAAGSLPSQPPPLAGEPAARQRRQRVVRDPGPLVAGRRDRSHRGRPREGGLPHDRGAPAVRRPRPGRAAPRGRARASPCVGHRARRAGRA